jgi:hypothetical protein
MTCLLHFHRNGDEKKYFVKDISYAMGMILLSIWYDWIRSKYVNPSPNGYRALSIKSTCAEDSGSNPCHYGVKYDHLVLCVSSSIYILKYINSNVSTNEFNSKLNLPIS